MADNMAGMETAEATRPRTYKDVIKKPRRYGYIKTGKPTGAKPRLSDEELLALSKAGKSHVDICKQYGYKNYTQIQQRMDNLGIPRKNMRVASVKRTQKVYSVVQETGDMIDAMAKKTGMGKGEIVDAAVAMFVKEWEKDYADI